MFVLRYAEVHRNMEALNRKEMIRLKNSICFDKFYGAITMTYFPINLALLPFLIPLYNMKSERLNDLVLKI